jgi:hypothetical protein
VLLLIDERRPEPPPRRRQVHVRVPFRVVPPTLTAIGLGVVAGTVGGATGAFAAIGALCASFKALERALPYPDGLRDYKQ